MPEQYSLKWNNFHTNLTTGFHGLFEDEDLVDVSLAVEGKIIQAHKVILSVCSPYFKSLFRVRDLMVSVFYFLIVSRYLPTYLPLL